MIIEMDKFKSVFDEMLKFSHSLLIMWSVTRHTKIQSDRDTVLS